MTRKEIAALRLQAASEHVEAAQHELERAVSALASLDWMCHEMWKVQALRDRIHEVFYRLAPISHSRAKVCAKAEIDREPEAGDEDPHKGCCAGYRPAYRADPFAGEIGPQDPVADAAEDEAFRVATARMDAAEAREDAAERKR